LIEPRIQLPQEEQHNGKLIQRMPVDAQIISVMSIKFFDIIYEICREAKITSKVPIVPAVVYQAKRQNNTRHCFSSYFQAAR
jgi:hypothetical protein